MRNRNWKYKLDISNSGIIVKVSDDKSIAKLSMYVASKIKRFLHNKSNCIDIQNLKDEFEEIIDGLEFLNFIHDKSYEEKEEYEFGEVELYEEFNYLLSKLYNLGDYNKLIWITF